MKTSLIAIAILIMTADSVPAHTWKAGDGDRESLRAHLLAEWEAAHITQGTGELKPVRVVSTAPVLSITAAAIANANAAPAQSKPFQAFQKLQLRWDNDFLYVESNGLPDHNMMVGITAWQQQVPLPQAYSGDNAWRVPLHPVPSKAPVSIRGRFLRGAIAIAANGIPIFNPQNNRGEVSQEIGELDQWGGHCGRADDYHYHAAPLHLQATLGKGLPIAYALDGYPIFGLMEPDGAPLGRLDEFNGHETATAGYHYHASTKYPYVNGGFHGEVVERDGQVDPQPRANPVRQDLPPLRGAKITNFTTTADGMAHSLQYMIGSKIGEVDYADLGGGNWKFRFVSTEGSTKEESYQARERRGGGPGNPRPREDGGGERNRRGGPARPRSGGPAQQEVTSQFGPDAMKNPVASFVLTSPEVADGGNLPVDYTGDGSGATLPLAWKGMPAGTKSYALIMDHLAPGNVMKSYWVVWDIPASTTNLPKNVQGIGQVGTSFKGQTGYEPPHSQGPGAKTYTLTIYALSAPLQITRQPRDVNRDVLLEAMKNKVLASSSLNVVYTRGATASNDGQPPPRRGEGAGANDRPRPMPRGAANEQPPQRPDQPPQGAPQGGPAQPPPAGTGLSRGSSSGTGGADNKGLIKPRMDDTIKVNVYADNWFVMFINGELVAVDSIKFTPHNVVSVDILPEYPMTIAILAKDNADPKTGLEYGDHIGDGGFIIKFADGTVSNATWKAKNFFKGPLNHDVINPKVEHAPIPDDWWKTEFDDTSWPNATEYTEERVKPKEPYYNADFKGATFIWSEDLDLDNTVIFRLKVEKPGWTKRWNTKPDLDTSGAPFK